MKIASTLFAFSLFSSTVAAAPIGRILVALGDVSAERGGQTISLKARADIEQGDLIKTGPTSNAQIRLTDGSIIALKPVTEFKFDDYQFTGKQDGSEKGAFSLLKGGFRTITGAIGKQNPDSYKVKTPVANIGIRGTFYNLAICDSACVNPDGSKAKDGLYGGVVDGSISVANQSGEKVFGNDQFFHVASASETPQGLIAPPSFLQDKLEGQKQSKKEDKQEQRQAQQTQATETEKEKSETTTTFQADSRTEAVTQTETVKAEPVIASVDEYKAADDANATGSGSGILGNRKALLVHAEAGSTAANSEFHGISEYFIDTGIPKISGVVTAKGEKVVIEATLDGFGSNNGNTGTDLFWGRWINGTITVYNPDGYVDTEKLGTGQAIHFIGGSQPVSLPTGTAVVYGTLVGSTTGSFSDGSGSAAVVAGANTTATINFNTATISSLKLELSVTRGGTHGYQINASGIPLNISNGTIASFASNGTYTTHTSGTNVLDCAPGGCKTDLAGFVSGSSGNNLGIGYAVHGSQNTSPANLKLSGVAGLKQ